MHLSIRFYILGFKEGTPFMSIFNKILSSIFFLFIFGLDVIHLIVGFEAFSIQDIISFTLLPTCFYILVFKEVTPFMSIFNKILSSIFILFISGLGVLHLIVGDEAFSEQENRSLAQFPSFSWESVFSGEFMEKVEVYISDQFPFK